MMPLYCQEISATAAAYEQAIFLSSAISSKQQRKPQPNRTPAGTVAAGHKRLGELTNPAGAAPRR